MISLILMQFIFIIYLIISIKQLKKENNNLNNIIIKFKEVEERKKNKKTLEYIKQLESYGLPNDMIKQLIKERKI